MSLIKSLNDGEEAAYLDALLKLSKQKGEKINLPSYQASEKSSPEEH